MKKRYLILIGILFLKVDPMFSQIVNFPYHNDLKGSNPPDVIAVGRNQIFTPNGIQLTGSNSTGQSGTIVLNGASFTSLQGLTIEFEYDMYAGNNSADGICFFLYDATTSLIDLPGHSAGALSYSYYRNGLSQGLNNAYLGIGFDEWGYFKSTFGQAVGLNTAFAQGRSHVTVRGAMRHEAIGADAVDANGLPTSNISSDPNIYDNKRFQGYPVLYTIGTNGGTGIQGQYLDMPNNSEQNVSYIDINQPFAEPFDLRGGVLNPPIDSPSYRKVIINLGPANPNEGGGYYITVDIYNGTGYVRVIDRFHYKEDFYYSENVNTGNAFPFLSSKNYSLQAPPPQEFKIGFGGSTGYYTQTQIIRNLVVNLAYTPRFEPDLVKLCGSVSDINVFANDFVYNGPIYGPPVQGNTSDDINYNSFKFTNSDILPYTELGSWDGDVLTYTVPNEGTWTYNKSTGLVNFKAIYGFSGSAKIYYTAKGTASLGGPFDQDEYYSIPTEIFVEKINCGGVINPQLPSGGVKRSNN